MNEKIRYFLYMLWFFYLILAGVYIFGKGFLLTRTAREEISTCKQFSEILCSNETDRSMCSERDIISTLSHNDELSLLCLPDKSKVILIVVDAFRYDFAVFNDSLVSPDYYQNKLPIIKDLLSKYPEKTRLYKFIADPPTTTLQRCKALTTGSLPTFIDAGSNFATPEINEDNVIDQLMRSGGSAVLLGDDTWEAMHPGRWLRQKALHSFHTWDLDTVDTAVDSLIFDELQQTDWNLLLAHYLGIDHAGHRYGPKHPEMARKLGELNDRLTRLVQEMPQDALLYVIGDHGMTVTGDHGGESEYEVSATFFAYSPSGLTDVNKDMSKRGDMSEVPQVDLTPTLSAALGLPPPFSNLGATVTDALPKSLIQNWQKSVIVLWTNVVQMMTYIQKYSADSNEFSKEKIAAVEEEFRLLKARLETLKEVGYDAFQTDARKWLLNVREMCREVWVRFDTTSIARGLLLVYITLFFNFLTLEALPKDRLHIALKSNLFRNIFLLGTISCLLILGLWYINIIDDLLLTMIFYISTSTLFALSIVVIKDWFIITRKWYDSKYKPFYERLTRTCLAISSLALFSNSFIIEEGVSLSYLYFGCIFCMCWSAGVPKKTSLYLVVIGFIFKVFKKYFTCREEHGECFLNVETKDTSESLVIALGSVALMSVLTRLWLKNKEDRVISLATLMRNFAPTMIAVLISGHFATMWGPYKTSKKSRQLGSFSWLSILVSTFILWVLPPSKQNGDTLCLKASFGYFSLLVSLAYVLTLGLKFCPGAALGFALGILTLELISICRKKFDKYPTRDCEFSSACLWAFLAVYGFYGTGHHPTFSHIRWSAAFASVDKDFTGHVVPAALVLMNTFGSHFLYGVASPLLVLWDGDVRGTDALTATFSAATKFCLCLAIRVAASMLAATIHCRHLMVWKIFAPKLIFEAGGLAAAMLGSTVAYLLACRIIRRTEI